MKTCYNLCFNVPSAISGLLEMVHNLLYLYWFSFSCRPLAIISSLFWEICLLFISDYSNAERGEPPLYMELEKDTPLQEDTAADAMFNPIYDRFVRFILVNFEILYFNWDLIGGNSKCIFHSISLWLTYFGLSILLALIYSHTRFRVFCKCDCDDQS